MKKNRQILSDFLEASRFINIHTMGFLEGDESKKEIRNLFEEKYV